MRSRNLPESDIYSGPEPELVEYLLGAGAGMLAGSEAGAGVNFCPMSKMLETEPVPEHILGAGVESTGTFCSEPETFKCFVGSASLIDS